MAKADILIVDDDRALASLIAAMLEEAGYIAHRVESADEAYAFLRERSADLALLDLNLPGISGYKLLELIRQEPRTAALPVIMLTVQGDEAHKLQGFKSGADDYLSKPFSEKELLARVEALLRRSRRAGGTPGDVLEAEGIRLDLDRQEVWVQGTRVNLTAVEFQILAALIRRRGILFSYRVLTETVSTGLNEVLSGKLYTHIKNIRKKLGNQGRFIETVYGVGYKFSP